MPEAKNPQQAQFDKMTRTPIPRLVMGLAVPTILSMLITSIYNLADTFFVGQISTSASGAVGVVPFMAQFLAELDRMDAAERRCKT